MGPVTAQSEELAREPARSRLGSASPAPAWRRRAQRVALVTGALLIALFFLAVFERVVASGDVMGNVEVDGIALGGKSERDAFAVLSALATELETSPLHVTAGDHEFIADASLLGVDVDERATLRAARLAARSRNPIEQTVGAVLRRFRPDRVDLGISYSDEGVEGVLDGWQREILDGDVEGDLRFEGTEVVEVEPNAGVGIVRDEARRILDAELRAPERNAVELPVGRVEPKISREEVARAASEARALLRGTHTLSTLGATLDITPEQLVTALATEVKGRRLTLTIDPEALRAALGESLAALERAPVDARFEVTSSNTVQVVPSEDGAQVDMAAVAEKILDGERDIIAPLEAVEPRRDTAWAESLGIKEQVSSFTTSHPSGQARVTNIHLAADFINNVVVEPGETFSLNEAIGPRTQERGFVTAPVFYGRFTEDFGGGVSQLATTFFNAVFFGGYEDVYHKPHTIYITRYPMGREATVNYGTVDLTFRNDSKTGILIRTSYTSSSISVTFYGDKEGRKVSEVDRKVLAERPVVDELLECPQPPDFDPDNVCATLVEGETKQVENGYPGIDVEYYRLIERPDREPERARFFWRYRMTPNRILVGTTPAPPTVPEVPPDATSPTTVSVVPTTVASSGAVPPP